ncbi:MAG: fasciclin domain-containing protein [Saprospiraceae bacterium]|nr:fasciclin domain-containing protein [Saprospiraceae bacterium]
MKNLYVFWLVIGITLSNFGVPAQDSKSPQESAALTASAGLHGQAGVNDDESQMDILKIAFASEDHSTLVAAVQATQMEHILSNAGPLTVFAPTNAAFDKLPDGTLEELLKPENKSKLANIITYHAAPGSYDAEHIAGVMGIGQATGDKVKVVTTEEGTTVNGAKVLATIKASNGYVHVIDAVLLPPE